MDHLFCYVVGFTLVYKRSHSAKFATSQLAIAGTSSLGTVGSLPMLTACTFHNGHRQMKHKQLFAAS